MCMYKLKGRSSVAEFTLRLGGSFTFKSIIITLKNLI